MNLNMKSMLDAGVHFGHQKERWNPKMKNFVYTSRGGIHIIDLQKTLAKAKDALAFVENMAANGERMIFVGTKKQAEETIQEAANKCGQYYVTKRWLGGTLTNFVTIKQSIDRLKKIDQMREKGELEYFSKKERSSMEKEYEKLNEYLQGIREMKEPAGLLFVVDITKEHIAVQEAKKLGIKVVGLCDTNSDPSIIDYPIPANDDAIRSIKLFSDLVADAYLAGAKKYEQKAREVTDKQSDVEKEQKEAPPQKTRGGRGAPAKTQQQPSGPNVVKAAKGRKLVAAGTADDIEILAEVEQEVKTDEPADKE
ncbi:MAG: 30S ribosomal protein S2 [Bdellovibrionaceae bacterium]|nr:30S ribosomal protein S2 [Pseudobdellovibrionaceae bacterium]